MTHTKQSQRAGCIFRALVDKHESICTQITGSEPVSQPGLRCVIPLISQNFYLSLYSRRWRFGFLFLHLLMMQLCFNVLNPILQYNVAEELSVHICVFGLRTENQKRTLGILEGRIQKKSRFLWLRQCSPILRISFHALMVTTTISRRTSGSLHRTLRGLYKDQRGLVFLLLLLLLQAIHYLASRRCCRIRWPSGSATPLSCGFFFFFSLQSPFAVESSSSAFAGKKKKKSGLLQRLAFLTTWP